MIQSDGTGGIRIRGGVAGVLAVGDGVVVSGGGYYGAGPGTSLDRSVPCVVADVVGRGAFIRGQTDFQFTLEIGLTPIDCELNSGPPSVGELLHVGRGGVRLTFDHCLPRDEVVRLLIPRKSSNSRCGGRMIIGHVAHSVADSGRRVVGIAFGWDAAVQHDARRVRKDGKSPSVFRPISARLRSWVSSTWRAATPRS